MKQSKTTQIHNKQFLISKKPRRLANDWNTEQLNGELYFNYSGSLNVVKVKDSNGCSWRFIGKAFKTDTVGSIIEDIKGNNTEDIFRISRNWAGRWLLIGNGIIYPDPSCLLGVFYSDDEISSSLSILGKDMRDSKFDDMGSYPLPRTRYRGVKKLLPSEYFDFEKWITVKRSIPTELTGFTYEQTLENIINNLKNTFINLSAEKKRLYLSLTAGYDSRLLLAMCSFSKVEVQTFTQSYKNISIADKKIPKILANLVGYPHIVIGPNSLEKEKLLIYDKHTGNDSFDMDREFYSLGQWDWVSHEDIVIRGGLFEIARCFYWNNLPSNFNYLNICNLYGIEDEGKKMALIEWEKGLKDEGIDKRDRLYLEQRIAGWVSGIEQSLDLLEGYTFIPANSFNTLSLLLSIPKEKRLTSEHHIDIIKIVRPDLLKIPFNQPDPKIKQIIKRISKVKKMPLKHVIKKAYNKILH